MSIKKTVKLLLAAVCLSLLGSFAAVAQLVNKGKFNTWTNQKFSRQNEGGATLKIVRSAKQDGFDRVVFEFAESIPGYETDFAKPPFYYGESGNVVKVGGKFFLDIHFLSTTAHDAETGKSSVTQTPKGKINLPNVQDVKMIYDFEANVEYVVGLKAKKQFRVLELQNPARLVIDFR